MPKVSTYLNFMGNTEEAFLFYKKVFGTDFLQDYGTDFVRMNAFDDPNGPPSLPQDEQNLVMNVQLPILGGHILMGTDMVKSRGHELKIGNNFSINLQPDTRAETERLFTELSDGGSEIFPLEDMPWGAYWGSFVDKFGIRWMFNCTERPANA